MGPAAVHLTCVALLLQLHRPPSQVGPLIRVVALASTLYDHVTAEPLTDFVSITNSLPSGWSGCEAQALPA